jgi:hypothetical protein
VSGAPPASSEKIFSAAASRKPQSEEQFALTFVLLSTRNHSQPGVPIAWIYSEIWSEFVMKLWQLLG